MLIFEDLAPPSFYCRIVIHCKCNVRGNVRQYTYKAVPEVAQTLSQYRSSLKLTEPKVNPTLCENVSPI